MSSGCTIHFDIWYYASTEKKNSLTMMISWLAIIWLISGWAGLLGSMSDEPCCMPFCYPLFSRESDSEKQHRSCQILEFSSC
jgi:hypothetical protein